MIMSKGKNTSIRIREERKRAEGIVVISHAESVVASGMYYMRQLGTVEQQNICEREWN